MSVITEVTETTITIIVPLQVRRLNGRPRIVLPDDGAGEPDTGSNRASGAVVRAIARAWDWRRRLEAGEAMTLRDIADGEKVTMPFVSRMIRLAYLSPLVLDRIISGRAPVAVSLHGLAAAALEPWAGQAQHALDEQG